VRVRCVLAGALVVLALTSAAAAETRNGITPLGPERGAQLAASEPIVFRVRSRGAGRVFLHVCRKRERVVDGVICKQPLIREMRRVEDSRRFRWTEDAFGLDPGRYYWQAYRIRCEDGARDCRQEGPIHRMRVTG
jgi:hypothetical protein